MQRCAARVVWAVMLAALVAGGHAAAAPSSACSGTLLVGLADGVAFRAAMPWPVARAFPAIGAVQLRVPPELASAWAERLARDPRVRYVEPDAPAAVLVESVPDDPLYPQQWALERTGAPAAWALTVGGPDTIVAVLDGGLDLTHPDLTGQLWQNPGEVPGNGLDDDGNGHVDDLHGWHFYHTLADEPRDDGDLRDDYGHGTGVAGLIAARRDNGEGIAGLAPGVRLMVVRIVDPYPRVCYSDLVAGILYALAEGAHIIHMSVGGTADSAALHDAVAAAVQQGVLLVAASGNAGDGGTLYPARYDDVVAVNATNRAEQSIGLWGPGMVVDIAAPGDDILTAWLSTVQPYKAERGTSFAAPQVSAAAALLRALRPHASAAELRAWLAASADDVNGATLPGPDAILGWGRLDVGEAAQRAAMGLRLELALPDAALPPGGETVAQVMVRDEAGQPAGSGVVVRLTAANATITPAEAVTNAGVVTATLRAGSLGGTAVITASLASLTHTVAALPIETPAPRWRYLPLIARIGGPLP